MLLRPNVLDATQHNLVFDLANGKQAIVKPDPQLFIRAEIEDTFSHGMHHLEVAPGVVCSAEVNETTYGGLDDPSETIAEYVASFGRSRVIVGSPLGMRALALSNIKTKARLGWPMGFNSTTNSAKGIFIPEARPLPKQTPIAFGELALQAAEVRPIVSLMVDDGYLLDANNKAWHIPRAPSPLRFDLYAKQLGYARGKIPLIGGYVKGIKDYNLSSVPSNALLLVYSDTFPWLPPEIASRAVCGGTTARDKDNNQLSVFKSLARYSAQTCRYARQEVGF